MTEQEKQKYYGNEAFETIYEKAKKDYAPQLVSYTPLDEGTLAERISAVLRPVYDRAIAAIFRGNRRSDAELDADAISRGMGSSTFVSDLKRRQDSAAAEDARELETEYGAKLADQLYKAMEGERDRLFEVEKFNAQQQNAAMEQAFSAAKVLYEAYLAAKAVQTGGSGGKKRETADESQVKNSLAQAVAAARGQTTPNPNGSTFYAAGEKTLVDRVRTSELPKYVELRNQMNSGSAADRRKKYQLVSAK